MAEIKKHATEVGQADSGLERPRPVILRLENLPATPRNLERIRYRVQVLNHSLEAAGAPFRLRVI